MTTQTLESDSRRLEMLATALGANVEQLLLDPRVLDITINPDGRLWVDRAGEGRSFTGVLMSPHDVIRAITLIASFIKETAKASTPLLAAELPGSGARVQAILSPVAQGQGPALAIRRHADTVYPLEAWVEAGYLLSHQRDYLHRAIEERKNVVIAGGTGSGKTSFTNALLSVIGGLKQRVFILEDTAELKCTAEDCVVLRTKEGVATFRDLLKATLRMRPDRIIIGEVRDAAAADFIKALNTGHPGGLCTVHADSAERALLRLEQLIEESGVRPSPRMIAETINVVVFIERTAEGRRIREVREVLGFNGERYETKEI
jgi:type IV secretion system protein VirB11